MQWSKEKQTDKGRQYNDLKKNKQTKVDNTMVKRKTNRQRSTIQWSKENSNMVCNFSFENKRALNSTEHPKHMRRRHI
jgi:hypothetical protein